MKLNEEQLKMHKEYVFDYISRFFLQPIETPEYICVIGGIEVHYYPTKQSWYAPTTGAKGFGIHNACEYATLPLLGSAKEMCSN